MDEEGTVFATQNDRTVAGFEQTLMRLQRLVDLRAKAKTGDDAAEIDVALLEGDLELLSFDEVQKRLDGKKLSDAQNELLRDVEITSMLNAVVSAGRDQAAAMAAAKKVTDAYTAGRVPASKGRHQLFYFIVFQSALAEGDPDLAQKALDAVKPLVREMVGNDQSFDAWAREQQEAVEDVRAKKAAGAEEGVEEGCGEGKK